MEFLQSRGSRLQPRLPFQDRFSSRLITNFEDRYEYKLRFTFRRIELPEGEGQHAAEHTVHGQMMAAEATPGQDISVDREGGAKAGSGKNKYLAPLALGVLAASSMDGDEDSDVFKNGVVSNGFGLVARAVTMAASNRGLALGFAYFALSKSIYKGWIAKGHEGLFPKGYTARNRSVGTLTSS